MLVLKGTYQLGPAPAYTPDGEMLVSGGDDQHRFASGICGMPVRPPALEGHTNSVLSLSVSPDGTVLAIGRTRQASPPVGPVTRPAHRIFEQF